MRAIGRAIGLDVHLDFCEVAICEEGKVRSAGRIETTPERLELFAGSLGPGDRVTLEVTGNAWEIARILEPHVAKVIVVSPADTGIRQARAKTDRLDARTLAKLLAAGERSRGERDRRGDVHGRGGDIRRFATQRQLVGYLGLDPKVRQSGIAPAKSGRISKQGSASARWALVEAAWSVVRQPGPLHAFYPRLRVRRGSHIATVAAARKLACLFWCLLIRGEDYAHQQPNAHRAPCQDAGSRRYRHRVPKKRRNHASGPRRR